MSQPDLISLVAARNGHFKYESGYHGDLWLELDRLLLHPRPLRRLAGELADRLASYELQAVCGPLIGGAFVAQWIAVDLDIPFVYAEQVPHPESAALYSMEYRVPAALRAEVRGKRVAVVDDVVSAGSAIRGALSDLEACGAYPAAIGTLLLLGSMASEFAANRNIPLERLAHLPSNLWQPSVCPLCAAGQPLEEPSASLS